MPVKTVDTDFKKCFQNLIDNLPFLKNEETEQETLFFGGVALLIVNRKLVLTFSDL